MKHRRIISLLSAALMGISVTAFPPAFFEQAEIVAEAAPKIETDGPWQYSYEPGSSVATIVKYIGSEAVPEIPKKRGGKTVTTIGKEAFENTRIQSVKIPSTVKTIETNAFHGCYSLTEIVIPSSVTKIKAFAFNYCTKLKKAEIKGAAKIYNYAFNNCTALENIIMNPNCSRAASSSSELPAKGSFNNCTSLTKINNITVVSTGTNGKPAITQDKDVKKLIELFMMRSDNIKFMKDYSNKLINYIIKTELVAGTSDAIHARQLHDWMISNCGYMTTGTKFDEPKDEKNIEYQTSDNLFMSYGLTNWVGEGVCHAFARAYQRLLTAAHIDSYILYQDTKGSEHSWNLAKIDGKWYYIDVTWDETSGGNSTYTYFMKTRKQMEQMDSIYKNCGIELNEALLRKDNNAARQEYLDAGEVAWKAAKNTAAYTDSNSDGVLDGDWNLDGVRNSADTVMKKRIANFFPSGLTDKNMKTWVYKLHKAHKTPEQFLTDEGF